MVVVVVVITSPPVTLVQIMQGKTAGCEMIEV